MFRSESDTTAAHQEADFHFQRGSARDGEPIKMLLEDLAFNRAFTALVALDRDSRVAKAHLQEGHDSRGFASFVDFQML
jgi:hypothetical protein